MPTVWEKLSFRPKGVRLTDALGCSPAQRRGRVREVLVSWLSSSNWLQAKAKGARGGGEEERLGQESERCGARIWWENEFY